MDDGVRGGALYPIHPIHQQLLEMSLKKEHADGYSLMHLSCHQMETRRDLYLCLFLIYPPAAAE